jgi:hypothetical protein
MEACYGGTDVMERSCAVARGIDINKYAVRRRVRCRVVEYCIMGAALSTVEGKAVAL